MKRRDLLLALTGLSLTPVARGEPVAGDPTEELERLRSLHRLPALAGLFISPRGVEEFVTGERKAGSGVRAQKGDQWHLGSNTKALTATLLGTLVDEKKLQWSATLGELLPADCRGCVSEVKEITLHQLLTHASGLPANLPDWWKIRPNRRSEILRAAAPEKGNPVTPGKQFVYSNVGYAVAGRVAEKAGGRTWEKLIQERVFQPLGMARSGFGPTGSAGRPDQPWPHRPDGTPLPDNGPRADNAPSLGPAGTVHATLADYAKFLAVHLGTSPKTLVQKDTLRFLQTPAPDAHFACGWVTADRPWARGTALHHAGSNTVNYLVAWLAPSRQLAVVACTNQGGERAEKACDELCAVLLQRAGD